MPDTPAAAPASDATLAAAPPHILVGEWDDAEWRAAAAKPARDMTEAEKYLFAGGPRLHPWGISAFTAALPDGKQAVFPSKAAYDAHMAKDSNAAHDKGQAAGQSGLDALNAGLAAGSAGAAPTA